MVVAHETLSQAARMYGDWIVARKLKDNTQKNKMQTLNHAKKVWGNPLVRRINASDVDRYFDAHQWAPKTRNLYLGNLREFFQFCRDRGIVPPDFDPTRGWRAAREGSSQMFWIPATEFLDLLEAADRNHPRDRMIVAIGLFCLLRGSEVQLLTFGDVDLKAKKLHFQVPKSSAAFAPMKEKTNPIVDNLVDEFERYFEWIKQTQGPIQPEWFLTPRRKKREFNGYQTSFIPPITMYMDQKLSHIYEPVNKAFAELGYSGPAYKGKTGNHALRRSGARMLLDHFRLNQGEQSALLRVSQMLGHKSIKDTMTYIGRDIENDQLHSLLAGTRIDLTGQADRQLRAVQ